MFSSQATAALERALKITSTPVIKNKHFPMISTKSLKRSLSSLGEANCINDTFDMTSLIESTQPVKDSIDFPTIEWSNDIDSDSDEDGFFSPPTPKRRCRGLVRTNKVDSQLSLLGSSSQLGSSGSLC
jgi:hypothetical protein